jgi:serine/threonine protein kinase
VIQDDQDEEAYWPIKIILPSQKTLALHFRSQDEQIKWSLFIKERTHQKNIKDFYRLEHPLGKGKFGEVRRGTHMLTGQRVAVKVIRKRDMKPIEIY